MTLAAGTTLGPYQIQTPIGAGGMGEVYKARDTRLDRTVAIKVLPEAVAADPDLKQRFEREAKTISSLNHPHICTLHDIGEQDGVDFLVMEYLEGETLAQRLEQGALPLDQALTVATQIADALDKAHRQGITHRDLKPGNIILTKAGAKLLDFGLAKLRPAGALGTEGVTAAATASEPLTGRGTILGTLQYMAPEQLEGKEADHRTDIFAFGAIVYEMVTGQRAFKGESQARLIAAILECEPAPMMELQALTPARLEEIVTTSLAKDPDERWQSAGDVGRQVRGILGRGGEPRVARPVTPPWKQLRVAWGVALLLAAVAGGLALLQMTRTPEDVAARERVQFSVSGATQVRENLGLALSPDGRYLAYVSGAELGERSIWIRPLDSTEERRLPGTEGAEHPFWSPDSQRVGFFAGDQVLSISVSGGPAQPICRRTVVSGTGAQGGASWGRDGTILFSDEGVIQRVPAAGGTATPVTQLTGDGRHRWPEFLPDGDHFLYLAEEDEAADRAIHVASLSSPKTTELVTTQYRARFVQPGYLLFVRERALMAQRFDVEALALEGVATPVVGSLTLDSSRASPSYTVSQDGGLAYRTSTDDSQLTMYDRTGTPLATLGEPGNYRDPVLSPDGTMVAVAKVDASTGNRNIWIWDVAREQWRQFTFDSPNDRTPVWSPDSRTLVWSRSGARNGSWMQDADGTGTPTLLLEERGGPIAWSSDGQFLSFMRSGDLWALPMTGADREPIRLTNDDLPQFHPTISPNGKWVAFAQVEPSGRWTVNVKAFPGGESRQRVSTDFGFEPRWRADGTELLYLALGQIMTGQVTAVGVESVGDTIEFSEPRICANSRRMRSPGNSTGRPRWTSSQFRGPLDPAADSLAMPLGRGNDLGHYSVTGPLLRGRHDPTSTLTDQCGSQSGSHLGQERAVKGAGLCANVLACCGFSSPV